MNRLPTITPSDMLSALKRAGFCEHHQKGSHLYLLHPISKRVTSVAMHNKDLPRNTMKEIIEQAGFTQEEFRKFI